MSNDLISSTAPADRVVRPEQVSEVVARACQTASLKGKRVLLIVPDGTRTAPVGLVFKALHDVAGALVAQLDVMIALGTHPPMSEEAICQRLEITLETRRTRFAQVRFLNHEWNN